MIRNCVALLFVVFACWPQTVAAQTCQGQCGKYGEDCSCDQGCFAFGDCCDDVCTFCGDQFVVQCNCEPACQGKACGDDGCGGSCGQCGAGEACVLGVCQVTECGTSSQIPDCNGDCALTDWLGDGFCDNGLWGAHFNCQGFAFDGGDCPPCTPACDDKACGPDGCGGYCGTCPADKDCFVGSCLAKCEPQKIRDCVGACYYQNWLDGWAGDGECREDSNCIEFDWDGGDCEPCKKVCDGLMCGPDPVCGQPCGYCGDGQVCAVGQCVETDCTSSWEVEDCNGTCKGTYYIGNGSCDDGDWTNFNCAAFNWDSGDCDPCYAFCDEQECGADPICGQSCGKCAEGEACLSGECVSSDCPDGDIGDCNGACADASYVGDGYCDLDPWNGHFNCEAFNWDGGDCEPCFQECADNQCGLGDCGLYCPGCGEGEICRKAVCVPCGCADLECGDDGCGQDCGPCSEEAQCVAGVCRISGCEAPDDIEDCYGNCSPVDYIGDEYCDVYPQWGFFECAEFNFDGGDCAPCVPTCEGRECGGDGCGGDCGSCGAGETCYAHLCQPCSCDGKVCGDDGCGSSCGACDEGTVCVLGQCHEVTCQPGGGELGFADCKGGCGRASYLSDDFCQSDLGEVDLDCAAFDFEGGDCPPCEPQCGEALCGDDGCLGSCGDCPEGFACLGGTCDLCSCDGLQCGPGPCGENCGECAPGQLCTNGTCIGPFATECLSLDYVEDCNGMCGPLDWLGDGTCQPRFDCPQFTADGKDCLPCTPDCDGRECGEDGCGGSCGFCPAQSPLCVVGSCQPTVGSEPSEDAGCPGCACESCVCSELPECCEDAWSTNCVELCATYCGGAGAMDACGDGQCDDGAMETCRSCPEDCGCTQDKVCAHLADGFACHPDVCGAGGLTEAGCCDGDLYSACKEDGTYVVVDCAKTGESCGWQAAPKKGKPGYACGPEASLLNEDPLGEHPSECSYCLPECDGVECGPDPVCGIGCGTCGDGKVCEDSVCVEPCVPACGGLECGPDPLCSESCGACLPGYECSLEGICECQPQCGSAVCGFDPVCGESCGECPANHICTIEGSCICVPSCSGKQCGPDGCGGICGVCDEDQVCSEDGLCECVPDCAGKTCGPDGCGGVCGACEDGYLCADGECEAVECIPDCTDRECGPDPVCGESCGDCDEGSHCANGTCVEEPCEPECGGLECGPDPVCGESCGLCGEGFVCTDGACVEEACVPDCGGLACGPDPVCGESCGTCGDGFVCTDGACVEEACVPDCNGLACGPDPVCNESCGDCGDGLVCTDGACVEEACEPDCSNLECGPDPVCGESCGDCGEGGVCSIDGTCVCIPDCKGKSCGDDGCGGECGACTGTESCLEGVCEAAEPDEKTGDKSGCSTTTGPAEPLGAMLLLFLLLVAVRSLGLRYRMS